MKQILLSLLFLSSMTVFAQNSVVVRPQKQQSTTVKNSSAVNTGSEKSPTGNIFLVRNAEEFINAIGSNRTIRIMSDFNLTPAIKSLVAKKNIKRSDRDNPYYSNAGFYIQDTYAFDQKELVFFKINNLTIEGVNMETAHIQTEHHGAFVLSFENCSNITLKNLTLGHVPQGFCRGGVIEMNNCRNCAIKDCDLYGCGTYGICSAYSNNITFSNSTIRDCSYGIMVLENCKDFHFKGSKFIRNKEFDLIDIKNCSNVGFTNCNISQNSGILFKLNNRVSFSNCSISHDTDKMGTSNYAIITQQ